MKSRTRQVAGTGVAAVFAVAVVVGARVTAPVGSPPGTTPGTIALVVPMPDPKLTPGDRLPVTADEVCVPGYATKTRNVTQSKKDHVYAAYGIKSHEPGTYEIDHLISLQLGGSNEPSNLWPEPYDDPAGARVKDRLENFLHDKVCSGDLSLDEVQGWIAADWYATWVRVGRP